ncbi:hypothetical protein [Luteibacter sp. ME-Dv--P-043b]|uniref:hypothetical protein n=1 Tax=Luteibacter sp. ME-Dv--P-043b TaxID=3040291 RepID=UPI0025550879|nr:hypothetical protein [Luteibacter sp. ME-Dv--P-043b]
MKPSQVSHRLLISSALLLGTFFNSTGRAETPITPTEIDLTPVVSKEISEMRITVHLSKDVVRANQRLALIFDTLGPSYERTTDEVRDLEVTDELGAVPMDAPTLDGTNKVWKTARNVKGSVTYRYRVPAASTAITHLGPMTYLQSTGGGLSGLFSSFLLAPASPVVQDITVRWHMSDGDQAVTNFSARDFEKKMSFDDLSHTLFVAGPLIHDPAKLAGSGLVIAGLAVGEADMRQARPWLEAAFTAMKTSFDVAVKDGYRIMVFSNDRQVSHSGVSYQGGFLFFVPAGAKLSDKANRRIIAHEIVHSMVTSYGEDSEDWYNEGIADYAAIIVPKQAGLYTPREYLDLINDESGFYYLNKMRQTPTSKFPEVKWAHAGAWTLGYSRGALYFANLDAELRNRKIGVTVFDLVQKMNDASHRGAVTNDTWKALLVQYAGSWAVDDWQSMLAGELIRPATNSYGECYIARPVVVGHYHLGFAHIVFSKGAIIKNVETDSNAFKAGLRDGDVLQESFNEIEAAKSLAHPVTLQVLRGQKRLVISFSPHEGSEIGYQWFPKSGDVDRACL